jgi:hypothetical protein
MYITYYSILFSLSITERLIMFLQYKVIYNIQFKQRKTKRIESGHTNITEPHYGQAFIKLHRASYLRRNYCEKNFQGTRKKKI